MKWEKHIKNIIWVFIYTALCVITIVNNFQNIIPGLEGHEIAVVLFFVNIMVIQFTFYLHHVKSVADNHSSVSKWMKKIDERVLSIHADIQKESKIDLITGVEATNLFKEFEGGIYHAYNAPLEYEKANPERLEVHIERYQRKKFERVNYYYPIFAHHDKELVAEWLHGVKEFYQILNKSERLNTKQKNNVTFYVPKEDYHYSSSCNITYFVNEKKNNSRAFIYLHNSSFMDMKRRKPKRVLLVYDEKTIEEVIDHIEETTQKAMIQLIGIPEFLFYLDKKLHN